VPQPVSELLAEDVEFLHPAYGVLDDDLGKLPYLEFTMKWEENILRRLLEQYEGLLGRWREGASS